MSTVTRSPTCRPDEPRPSYPSTPSLGAVNGEPAPCCLLLPIQPDDAFLGASAGHHRTHRRLRSRACADLHPRPPWRSRRRRPRLPLSPTIAAAEIAIQRSPAEPNAAATKWSAAKSMSASGSTIAWSFAPPSACTACRHLCRAGGCRARSVPSRRRRRERPASRGWRHGFLSPPHLTPSGIPACCHSSATSSDGTGALARLEDERVATGERPPGASTSAPSPGS